MIPRIRGQVGQAIEDRKWYFEISIWTFDGEKQIGKPFLFGPHETKEIADQELKKKTQEVCEIIEKNAGCEPSGKYLDMKNGGVLRPWKEHS